MGAWHHQVAQPRSATGDKKTPLLTCRGIQLRQGAEASD